MLVIDEGQERFAVAATWPDGNRGVSELTTAIGLVRQQQRDIVHYTSDGTGPPRYACVAYPVEIDGRPRAFVAIQVPIAPDLQSKIDRLRWGAGWLETVFRRAQNQDDDAHIKRMAVAMDVLGSAGEHRELYACIVAVANELAIRLDCSRVSIGVVRRNRVRLVAISNAAVVENKSTLVEAIENAMEEASVQRQTIATPTVPSLDPRISLAHQELMSLAASVSVASVILPSADRVVGVITLERSSGCQFDVRSVHLLEAVAHLLGPLVEMKVERRRLVGGRLVDLLSTSCTALLGRRRPAIKLAAVAAIGVLAYGAFAQGDFRISGKALIEGAIQRAAVAPFDGFVSTAPARAGDIVTAGQLLATLDDRALTLELLRVRSEFEQQAVKYSDAMGQHDPVAARLATALMEQSKAEIAQVEDRRNRAKIVAPFSGIIVSGDLRQMLGSPVSKGQVLFQVAPLDSFRVILQVDERDISFVSPGQTGQVILTGFSKRFLPFKVKVVTPVATASEGRNYFPVEAEVENFDEQLRPGMEGIGKISIERHRLLWIWTRPLLDWAEITAWKWAP